MSLTLGEKLRQAREERGISISEVAEQTRISRQYLECIENNDYKILPGGIFNKGFVKSYAKYVGVDEQEALRDYTQLMSDQGTISEVEEPKTYRPEVLTDDNARASSLPTIIFAIVMLALLAGGVWAFLNYWKDFQNQPVVNNSNTNKPVNNTANANTGNTNTNSNVAQPLPATNEIKVEFKATAEPISVEATVDGKKSNPTVAPDAPQTYIGQQSVKIKYYRGFADKVQFTINGKPINAPAAPPNGKNIEFEINKDNISQILTSGTITLGAPAAPVAANTNTAPR
jgi:cytoskeleton protein RodZ